MRLTRLEIQNYKSLRNVAIEPTSPAVLVGANASGKTNFADALDFLGIAYRWGLEQAVAAKGGFENICFRSARRTKSAVRISVQSVIPAAEWVGAFGETPASQFSEFRLVHNFEVRSGTRETAAQFAVFMETLEIAVHGLQGSWEIFLTIDRSKGQVWLDSHIFHELLLSLPILHEVSEDFPEYRPRPSLPSRIAGLPTTQLILKMVEEELFLLGPFTRSLGSLRVFQLNPRTCREAGVPTPNAELDRFGGNLPAALDHLKKNYPESYAALLETVRKVLPSVESLDTGFTHTKTLALFLRERGFGRPWPAEDVSDGTLQTIALLVALFDPRSKIVVIEEPENSIHPWALRNFVEAVRQASEQKQVFLTTHSPVLIDQLRPEELWVVRRPGAETLIDPLPSLDPAVTEAWGEGKFTLSEYLDSGALPDAVPAAGSGR